MKRLVDDAELRILLKHHLIILEQEAQGHYPLEDIDDDKWQAINEQSHSMLNKYETFIAKLQKLITLIVNQLKGTI